MAGPDRTTDHGLIVGLGDDDHPHYLNAARHTATSHTHAALTDVTADQHHAQVHVLDSSNHTVSGLTAGHVLQATGATTFAFGQLDHGALGGLGDNDHTQYALLTGATFSGDVGIGIAPSYALHVASAYGIIESDRHSADASGGGLLLRKSRHATIGSHTIVQSGDELGTIWFQGSDGSAYRGGARITSYVDGTPGASDMPGRLAFFTTPDGSATPTERMRIDSAGIVSVAGAGSYTVPDIARTSDPDTGPAWPAANTMIIVAGGKAVLTISQAGMLHLGAFDGSLELGRNDGTAWTPFIDFHTGSGSNDYDARILASGGAAAGTADLLFYAGQHRFFLSGSELLTVDSTTRMSGAWTTFTPTWTGSVTNPVIGNGTLGGRYSKIGRTAFVRCWLYTGSTTTYGSGTYSFATPLTAASWTAATDPAPHVGLGIIRDSDADYTYFQNIYLYSTTTTRSIWDSGPRPSAGYGVLGQAGTIGWNTGDWFEWSYTYETAA